MGLLAWLVCLARMSCLARISGDSRSSMTMWRQECACVASFSYFCLCGLNTEEEVGSRRTACDPTAGSGVSADQTFDQTVLWPLHRTVGGGKGADILRHPLTLLSPALLLLFAEGSSHAARHGVRWPVGQPNPALARGRLHRGQAPLVAASTKTS